VQGISRQLTEQAGGRPIFGPPKSAAGQRTVIIPAAIIPDLAWHLARFSVPGDEGLLFTSSNGLDIDIAAPERSQSAPAKAAEHREQEEHRC
jgi:hypothetical protein